MSEWSFYDYSPSKAAAIIFIFLYGASCGYNIFQLQKPKTYFFITFVIGASMMTLGYIFRAASAANTNALGLYIGQNVCILLPPSLYAATIYMIYGRIVIFVRQPQLSIIDPYKVTKIFVIGDVFAFLMQASGGGMMAISSMASLGQKIIVVGLFVQLIFFTFFLTISIIFERRFRERKFGESN